MGGVLGERRREPIGRDRVSPGGGGAAEPNPPLHRGGGQRGAGRAGRLPRCHSAGRSLSSPPPAARLTLTRGRPAALRPGLLRQLQPPAFSPSLAQRRSVYLGASRGAGQAAAGDAEWRRSGVAGARGARRRRLLEPFPSVGGREGMSAEPPCLRSGGGGSERRRRRRRAEATVPGRRCACP